MYLYTRAQISAHEFDDCRFDVGINDCIWYLRARSSQVATVLVLIVIKYINVTYVLVNLCLICLIMLK